MIKQFILTDGLGWGTVLWFIGYVLGIVLFFFVPQSLVGWIIMPIGTLITVWILVRKISFPHFSFYLWLGCIWLGLALVLDYIFLVSLFKPSDGYYKLDVYIYYALIFLLPVATGLIKKRSN